MFGRFLTSAVRVSSQMFMKPALTTTIRQPLSIKKMQTISILQNAGLATRNFQLQNLLQFLQKCEKEMEQKSEVNSLNQLSLLNQGTLTVDVHVQTWLSYTQAGLTKLPVSNSL